MHTFIRLVAAGLVAATLAACTSQAVGPAGVPSSSDVNPITGARGGTNAGGGGGGGAGGAGGGGGAGH